MKTINVSFEDHEYKKIKKIKLQSKKNWHDFLLDLIINKNQVSNSVEE